MTGGRGVVGGRDGGDDEMGEDVGEEELEEEEEEEECWKLAVMVVVVSLDFMALEEGRGNESGWWWLASSPGEYI